MVSLAMCLPVSVAFGAPAQASCDESLGQSAYNKCAACHSLDAGVHLSGPSLADLDGRRAGAAVGYTYSLAMEDAAFDWNPDTLSAFLESPMTYLPGNAMPFAGLKNPDQRAALVCYLLKRD